MRKREKAHMFPPHVLFLCDIPFRPSYFHGKIRLHTFNVNMAPVPNTHLICRFTSVILDTNLCSTISLVLYISPFISLTDFHLLLFFSLLFIELSLAFLFSGV